MSFFDIARPPAPSVYEQPRAKPDATAPATAVASGAVPSASAAPAASTPTATTTTTPSTTATANAAAPSASAGGADLRSTEFKAVTNEGDSRDGGMLMVEAYSVLWMLLMGWIVLLWRKQNGLNVRLDDLERAIDASADKQDASAKKSEGSEPK